MAVFLKFHVSGIVETGSSLGVTKNRSHLYGHVLCLVELAVYF